MLTNADIVSSIDGLSDALRRAREALTHSDDLPPLDLAETMVLTAKLGEKLDKLADRVQSLAAPLFAEGAANGEETNGEETNGEETNGEEANDGEERPRRRSR